MTDRWTWLRRPWTGLLLCLLLAVSIYFFPFVFRGKHILPFHYEPGESTAIPNGEARPSIYRKFPGNDNSPILIHYPNAAFTGSSLRGGRLPLWNPYVGSGAPAMGNGQVYPFSPFLWPFYLHSTPWIYTLGLLLGCIWSALGAFLWLGRFDMRNWQRWFGAVFWTFNPWTLKIIIFSNVWAAWWFGWLLWAWDRAIQKEEKNWWLPAVMVAGMVYCGHPEVAFLLAEASVFYAVVLWVLMARKRRVSPGLLAARGLGVAVLAGCLTAVHTLPVLFRLAEVYSYKFGHADVVTASKYAMESVFNPRSEVYLSPLVFGLGFLGLGALCKVRKRLWSAAALWGFAFLLCFRPIDWSLLMDPLTGWGAVPGIYARSILWCAMAPIAAAGVGTLWEETGGRWRPLRLLLLGPLAFAALSVASYQSGAMIYLFLRKDLLLYYALALSVLAIAALVPRGKPRATLLAAGLVMACLSPLVESSFRYSYFTKADPTVGGPPAVAKLRALQGGGHGRFSSVTKTGWHAPCLSPDLASLWRVRDVRQVDALLTKRYVDLQLSLLPEKPRYVATWLFFQRVTMGDLGLLGVRWFGTSLDRNSGRFEWREIKNALPRAYIVHGVIPSPGEPGSLGLWTLLHGRKDFSRVVVLEGWKGKLSVGGDPWEDSLAWVEDGDDRVRLKTRTAKGGILVLLDSFGQGWRADVDGKPTRIYPANLAFRGVELPAGSHEVCFRYAPSSVTAGLVLALLGWLAVGVLTAYSAVGKRR